MANLLASTQIELAHVRLLAMDVDGVLTDGILGYDENGDEHKHFHVADGLGLVTLLQCGLKVAWVSGRKHAGVERRATELGIVLLRQGVKNKAAVLLELSALSEIPLQDFAFIGDDWNDLPALQIVGIPIAVANAAIEVKQCAVLVTANQGGHGAVREVCDAILDAQGIRSQAIDFYLSTLRGA